MSFSCNFVPFDFPTVCGVHIVVCEIESDPSMNSPARAIELGRLEHLVGWVDQGVEEVQNVVIGRGAVAPWNMKILYGQMKLIFNVQDA